MAWKMKMKQSSNRTKFSNKELHFRISKVNYIGVLITQSAKIYGGTVTRSLLVSLKRYGKTHGLAIVIIVIVIPKLPIILLTAV